MEETITAWIARDENGFLSMYLYNKPVKDESLGMWYNLETYGIEMNEDVDFPQVKWEDDEPTKVELTIKICK